MSPALSIFFPTLALSSAKRRPRREPGLRADPRLDPAPNGLSSRTETDQAETSRHPCIIWPRLHLERLTGHVVRSEAGKVEEGIKG
jgi:hypothetical protein